jgi:hypothetical protein
MLLRKDITANIDVQRTRGDTWSVRIHSRTLVEKFMRKLLRIDDDEFLSEDG